MTTKQINDTKKNLVRQYYGGAPLAYVDTHRMILANAGVCDWRKPVPEIALELTADEILARDIPAGGIGKRFPNVN